MMIKKYFFVFVLFTISQYQLIAQKTKNRKDSTVVVIFNENKNAGWQSNHKKTGEENIVKIAPLGFISGTYPILFERVITDFFTIQVGAGVTGKNYFRGGIQKSNKGLNITYPWDDNGNYNDAADPLFEFKNRKASIGYMFTIQPRLYFDSEAPDGSFIGVSYDYYDYKLSIPGLVPGSAGNFSHKGSSKTESEKINDIMVHFGYQTIYDRLTIEYTTSIGLRNVKGTKYVASYDYNSSSINYEGYASYKQNIFNFGVGIKVGYHF